MLSDLERAIEKRVGKSVEEMRSTTFDEARRQYDSTHHHPTRFISFFPFIGRGHAMRDRLLSREDIEDGVDEALE